MEISKNDKAIRNLTNRLGLVSEIVRRRFCQSVRGSIWSDKKIKPQDKQRRSDLVGIKWRHTKRVTELCIALLRQLGADSSYESLMAADTYGHDTIRDIEALKTNCFEAKDVNLSIYNEAKEIAINNFVAYIVLGVKRNASLTNEQKLSFIGQIDKILLLRDGNKIFQMLMGKMKITDNDIYWSALESFISGDTTNIGSIENAEILWKKAVQTLESNRVKSQYFDENSVKEITNEVKSQYFSDHASFAAAMLFERKGIDKLLDILDLTNYQKERLKRVLYGAIAYHQMDISEFPQSHKKRLNLPEDKWILESNAFELILNDNTSEEVLDKISSLLAQILRDIDKLDILIQNKTKDMPVFEDTIALKTFSTTFDSYGNDYRKYLTFDQFLELNGLSKEKFIEDYPTFDFNKLNEFAGYGEIRMDNYGQRLVKYNESIDKVTVPITYVPFEKLQVPEDIKKLFYDEIINSFGGKLSLKILMGRPDWNKFWGMWWRLQAFLTDVNFVQTLIVVRENHILEDILAQYPDAYKPLVLEAFEHAKRKYLDQVIENNKDNIYKRAS